MWLTLISEFFFCLISKQPLLYFALWLSSLTLHILYFRVSWLIWMKYFQASLITLVCLILKNIKHLIWYDWSVSWTNIDIQHEDSRSHSHPLFPPNLPTRSSPCKSAIRHISYLQQQKQDYYANLLSYVNTNTCLIAHLSLSWTKK